MVQHAKANADLTNIILIQIQIMEKLGYSKFGRPQVSIKETGFSTRPATATW